MVSRMKDLGSNPVPLLRARWLGSSYLISLSLIFLILKLGLLQTPHDFVVESTGRIDGVNSEKFHRIYSLRLKDTRSQKRDSDEVRDIVGVRPYWILKVLGRFFFFNFFSLGRF